MLAMKKKIIQKKIHLQKRFILLFRTDLAVINLVLWHGNLFVVYVAHIFLVLIFLSSMFLFRHIYTGCLLWQDDKLHTKHFSYI